MKHKLRTTACILLSFLFSAAVYGQIPVAAFSLDNYTICTAGTLQVTDLSSDSPGTWSYTLSGASGGTYSIQNPTLSLTVPGTYTLSLVAGNTSGNSSPATQTFVVKAPPVVSGGGSVAVCAGDYVTLSGSGALSYSWTGGVIDGVSFPPLVNAVYTVTGVDADGCENSATVPLIVNPLPVLTISGPGAVCAGETLTLAAGGASSYTWSTGANSSSISDLPSTATSYTVEGMLAATGCSNIAQWLVAVNPLPLVAVNSGAICSGKVFTITPAGALSYTISGGSTTVSPASDQSYTVTGKDLNGCTASAISDVTVNPLPVISVNSGSICSGDLFTINPSGAFTYTYLPGLSPHVSPVSGTSYSVTGTDVNGCVSVAAAISQVTVRSLPLLSVNSGSVCAGNVFTIIPNSPAAVNYTFSGGSATVIPGANDTYTVMAEDASGCISLPAVASVTVAPLPVVSVNSGTLCAGSVYTLTPSGAVTYIFLNGASTVSPLTSTSYSVSGFSAAGCESATYAVADLTVYALPVISVAGGSICAGEIFTLVPSGADSYTFQGGTATVSPVTNTSYSVMGTSQQGCVSAIPAVASVTVEALPVLSVSGTSVICAGETASFTVSGASTYTWNTQVNLATYTLTPITSFNYTVTGSSASGCRNSTTWPVTVHPLPTLVINSGTICQGSSFTLQPSGASSYTYSGGAATVTPPATSFYTVTGSDNNGCLSAAAVSTVNVINAVTVAVSGNTLICEGEATQLTASGAATYTWSTAAHTATVSVQPPGTTSYTVQGMNTACSSSAVITVSVHALPVLTVSSSQVLLCTGETATLTAGGALSYLWSTGLPGAFLVISPALTGTYAVKGTDVNQCSATASFVQQVSECLGLSSPESGAFPVSVYPNPGTGIFTLQSDNSAEYEILNSSGMPVYTGMLLAGKTILELREQPEGLYFMQLRLKNGIKTIKIIKN